MRARKIVSIIIPLFAAVLFLSPFPACEQYVLPSVELSADTLRFGPQADSAKIQLFTNVIVSVESEETWLSADPDWSDADTSVTIRVLENTETEARSATLPFKSEAIQRNLVVIQEGL